MAGNSSVRKSSSNSTNVIRRGDLRNAAVLTAETATPTAEVRERKVSVPGSGRAMILNANRPATTKNSHGRQKVPLHIARPSADYPMFKNSPKGLPMGSKKGLHQHSMGLVPSSTRAQTASTRGGTGLFDAFMASPKPEANYPPSPQYQGLTLKYGNLLKLNNNQDEQDR